MNQRGCASNLFFEKNSWEKESYEQKEEKRETCFKRFAVSDYADIVRDAFCGETGNLRLWVWRF